MKVDLDLTFVTSSQTIPCMIGFYLILYLLNDLMIRVWEYDEFQDMLKRFLHQAIQAEYMILNKCLVYEDVENNTRELCSMFSNLLQLIILQYLLLTIKNEVSLQSFPTILL